MNDLTVVVPVFNEDPVIVENLFKRIRALGADCLIVDDGDTMGLKFSVGYKPHTGYGFAIKTGIYMAKTPLVLTMDGDGQHRIEDVTNLYKCYKMLKETSIDVKMVVGVRHNLKETWYRYWGRKCINFYASCIAGHYMIDLNSGMRIFDRKLANDYHEILCNHFSFTTSLTMAILADGYQMAWLPIKVLPRKSGNSRVKVFSDALTTLRYATYVGLGMRTRRIRGWLRKLRHISTLSILKETGVAGYFTLKGLKTVFR